jgi:hypothetical protein
VKGASCRHRGTALSILWVPEEEGGELRQGCQVVGSRGRGWLHPGELSEMQGSSDKVDRIEAGQIVGSLHLVTG